MPPAARITSLLAVTAVVCFVETVELEADVLAVETNETPVALVPFSKILLTLDPVMTW